MFQKRLIYILVFFSCCVFSTENIHSVLTKNLQKEELIELFSQIDTSNLQEIAQGLSPSLSLSAIPNSKFDLLKFISEKEQAKIMNDIFNPLPFARFANIPKPPTPMPPPKIVFTNKTKREQSFTTAKQVTIITNNEKYIKTPKINNTTQQAEVSGWENFRWDEWEQEEIDPLAALKTPPLVDGFGELKVYSLQVNSDSNSRAYALKDDVYTYLTRKIKEVAFQIDYRFNLLIQAKISDEAEVYYNVSQEPDMPQKTDVSLKVRQTWVHFGYSENIYKLGSFTDVSKKIDGISVEGNEGPFTYTFGFGSEKSKSDTFSRQGDGGDEYELRNKPVLENSVQVWVNGQLQALGKDYTINYFEGKIIFITPKTSSDTLRFSYQYTNPIEEFIPIASNVNMLGINAKYDNKNKKTIVKKLTRINKDITTLPIGGQIKLKVFPIELESELIFAGDIELKRNSDYYIRYNAGTILFSNKKLENLNISYLSPETNSYDEQFKGNGERVALHLKHTPLLNNSETISLQGKILESNRDYKIDHQRGTVVLKYPIPNNNSVSISYRQLQYEIKNYSKAEDLDYDVNFSYVRQFAKSQEDINTKLTSETLSSPTKNTITINLSNWPIVEESLSIYRGTALLTNNEIDTYTGTLTINLTNATSSTENIVINYNFYKDFGPQQWNFSGSNSNIENNVFYNNLAAHRIKSNLLNPVKYDPNNTYIKIEYKKDDDIFRTLEPGLDYNIVFNVDEVKEGQIYVMLYHEHGVTVDNSSETITYGLPSTLSDDDLFKVTYYYTNSNVPDAGEIVNEQFELLYNQKINNNFGFSVDVARSNKQYTKHSVPTTDTFLGTGFFHETYPLTAGNIVENSESVYINGNVAIRDMDYYINLNSGQITFIDLNPGTNDSIRVEYSYYSTESGGTVTNYEENGSAIALRTNVKNDFHNTIAEIVYVDDTFSPVGNSKYSAGSNILQISSKIKPSKEISVQANAFTNRINSTYKSNTTGKYLEYYENKYKLETTYSPISIFKLRGLIDIQSYATETNVDDNKKPIDKLNSHYLLALTTGPSSFQTNILMDNFNNLDQSNRTTDLKTVGQTLELKNALSIFSNNIRLKSSYKQTTELQTSANEDVEDNLNKKYSFDLGLRPINFIKINGAFSQENTEKTTAQGTTTSSLEIKTQIKNYSTNMSFTPPIALAYFNKPNYSFNLSNTEKNSILDSYAPDATNAVGNRLSFGLFNATSLALKNSLSESLQSDKKINKQTHLSEYSFSQFNVLKETFPITIKPFSRKFTNSSSFDNIGNTTTLKSKNKNRGEFTKYGASWKYNKFYNGNFDYSINKTFANSTENKTTEIIHSSQVKPSTYLKLINNLNIRNVYKTNYIYENNENEEQKFTYHLTTSPSAINSITTYNNTTHLYSNIFKNIFLEETQPIFLNNSYIYDDYVDSAKGLKKRLQEDYDLFSSFSFSDKIRLKPQLKVLKTDQFTTVSDNYAITQIDSVYDQRLYNNKLNLNLETAYLIIEKTNLIANTGYETINEDIYTRNSGNNVSLDPKAFEVYSFGVGVETRIFDGLFLKGTYTLKNNKDKNAASNNSNSSQTIKLEAKYSPITSLSLGIVENIGDVIGVVLSKATLSFLLEYNQGRGINSYTVEETESLIDKTVETKIENIENLRIKGAFKSMVEVPLTEQSNGMIEKFVFTSEAQMVIKNDYANATGINYSILGLMFSGKLIF